MVGLAITRPMHHLTPGYSVEGYQHPPYHTAGSSSGVENRYQQQQQQRAGSIVDTRIQNLFSYNSGNTTSGLSGLRTPPPEGRRQTNSMHSQSYVDGPFLKQFEPPIPPSVPSMVDSFLSSSSSSSSSSQLLQYHNNHLSSSSSSSSRKFDSPPSRGASVAPISHRPSSSDKSQACSGIATIGSYIDTSASQYMARETNRKSSTSTRNLGVSKLPLLLQQDVKASISDFAAQMICFFWFESSYLLHRIEDAAEVPVLSKLAPDAIPTPAFRKWATTILSTTQVSHQVIILALLFVYRLKKLNPSVRGKTGSEFRMITVALMLGNKFLDDNTYTNKTWAEVSGISVQEIHVMEVEFLQNMKYNLFTSEKQWIEWQNRLCRFWKYWDKAAHLVELPARPIAPARSPIAVLPPPFPSPPNSQQSSPPLFGSNQMLPYPTLISDTIQTPSATPLGELPMVSRKRSIEDIGSLMHPPPAKRLSRSMAPNISVQVPHFPVQIPPPAPLSAGLVPRLTSGPGQAIASIPSLQSGQLPLPGPGNRAMSMVFPNPNINWNPSPVHGPTPSSAPITHNITIPTFNSQSRNSSPYLHDPSNTPSPTSAFPGHQGHNLSPSFLLGNRSSPYRPVRGVSSLLVPSATQNPAPNFNLEQIQYHPLTKARNQYRTGVLPYLPQDYIWGIQHAPQNNDMA